MLCTAQFASVAGPSGVRHQAKRNDSNKISSPQNVPKHDTTTTLPFPQEKTRRLAAELHPKPMPGPDEPRAPFFDVKSIVPQTKSAKTVAQLREASSSSKMKNLSIDNAFLCIDGELRNFDFSPQYHQRIASEQLHVGGSNGEAVAVRPRQQFMAFGIEAYPTTALYNDICHDFVRPGRWCGHGTKCYRIHPLHKSRYLGHVLDSRPKNIREDVSDQPEGVSREQDALQSSAQVGVAAPVTPLPMHLSPPPPALSHISPTIHPLPPRPPPRLVHVPLSSLPYTSGRAAPIIMPEAPRIPYASSDTSSEADHVPSTRSRRAPRASFPDDDIRAWQAYPSPDGWSDSDNTVEDEVPRVVRVSRPSAKVAAPPSNSSTSSLPSSSTAVSTTTSRPRTVELCRRFMNNRCPFDAKTCHYIHDSPSEKVATETAPKVIEEPRATPPVEPQATEPSTTSSPTTASSHTFSMTLHDHMRVTFGAGFCVENVVTGFETQWVFIGGLPEEISDAKVQWLLHPYGEVHQVRRLTVPTYSGFNAQFANAADAYKAFSKLNGTKQYGNIIELRMSTKESTGAKIRDTVVRVEWEYKTRSVVVGYESEELRRRAMMKARTVLFQGVFVVRASIHTGTPSCGAYPLRFDDLPCDPTESEMRVFGPCRGMVLIQKMLVGTALHLDSVAGIEQSFKRYSGNSLVSLDVSTPPYSKGKMRAWAEFKTAADARQAAANLNGRMPGYTNHTRVTATHLYSLLIPMSAYKFRGIEAAFMEFSNRISHASQINGQADAAVKVDKGPNVILKLLSPDMAALGRMKSNLDKIIRGEILMQNGKIAWDSYFAFPAGTAFLDNLQQELGGLRIDRHFSARTIRLFGTYYVRKVARDSILTKIAQLQAQRSHIIPLSALVVSALIRDKFGELKKLLGNASETMFFDLWLKQMKVRADEHVIRTVSDFIDQVRREVEDSPDAVPPENACPICLSEPSSPVYMPCGHTACKACMKSYLQAATELKSFPLKCLGDGGKCSQHVPLSISKTFLHASDNHALLNAAFISHIERHPAEFHYCPTPDCPQIYRTASSGCFIQCPSCLVKICAGCNKDAHEGLTCKEVNEGDQLFREWLQKHASDVKQCPSCKMAIEKIDGCNHMQCGMCKAHVCWECLATFKDSGETYGHMRDVHGGFGLGAMD